MPPETPMMSSCATACGLPFWSQNRPGTACHLVGCTPLTASSVYGVQADFIHCKQWHTIVPSLQRREVELRRTGRHRACFANRLQLVRHIEVDFVLKDFLNNDLELVVGADVNERTGTRVEGDEPFLDQRGELEPAAHFVDDSFFFQSFDHEHDSCGITILMLDAGYWMLNCGPVTLRASSGFRRFHQRPGRPYR